MIIVKNDFFKSTFDFEIEGKTHSVMEKGPSGVGLYSKRSPVRRSDNKATINIVAQALIEVSEEKWQWKKKGEDYLFLANDHFMVVSPNNLMIRADEELFHPTYLKAFALACAFSMEEFEEVTNLIEEQGFSFEAMLLASDCFYFAKLNKLSEIEVLTLKKESFDSLWDEADVSNDYFAAKGYNTAKTTETKKKSTRTKAKVKGFASKLYKDICDGKYVIPYEWDERQKKSIMPLSYLKKYIPSDAFFDAFLIMQRRLNAVLNRLYGEDLPASEVIGEDYLNFNIIGPPGTGKTAMAEALLATFGLPMGITRNSDDTDSDEYEGKTRLIDGKPQFCMTDAPTIFGNGGGLLNEEINLAPASVVMGALGQAVEKPFILKVNGYKAVKRHPLCVIMNLFNIGTVGSKTPSQPFMTRFPTTFFIDNPSKEQMVKIMMSKSSSSEINMDNISYKNEKFLERVLSGESVTVSEEKAGVIYDTFDRTLKYLKSISADETILAVSLRHCIEAIKLIEMGFPMKKALELTIVGAVKIYDVDYCIAEEVTKNVLNTLPID